MITSPDPFSKIWSWPSKSHSKFHGHLGSVASQTWVRGDQRHKGSQDQGSIIFLGPHTTPVDFTLGAEEGKKAKPVLWPDSFFKAGVTDTS